jgi:hypothetical protein
MQADPIYLNDPRLHARELFTSTPTGGPRPPADRRPAPLQVEGGEDRTPDEGGNPPHPEP